MIKRNWVCRHDKLPERLPSSRIIQSWDTASKEGGENDYSVCVTLLVHEKKFYLVHILRGRFDYPTLKAKAMAHAEAHKPNKILIEDTGVGTALAPELKKAGFSAIAIKPEHNKITRMSIQSAKIESGLLSISNNAPWLAELEPELFGFPNVRHDDQVDALSQALAHADSGYDGSAEAQAAIAQFYGKIADHVAFMKHAGCPWFR
jgi:predicted phage terminase large subunit-like protein